MSLLPAEHVVTKNVRDSPLDLLASEGREGLDIQGLKPIS
jgi:hypothetical protein